jgi:hypothetical protein
MIAFGMQRLVSRHTATDLPKFAMWKQAISRFVLNIMLKHKGCQA